MNRIQKSMLFMALVCTLLSGCFVAPLRVANPLAVTVVDADNGTPIPQATVIYIVSDIHDYACKEGRVVRTTGDKQGSVYIPGKRRWGFYIAAPGGLPVADHLIAIWAPGYSTYIFSQYSNITTWNRLCRDRSDILQAISEIPQEKRIDDPWLNLRADLIGGKIKLTKSKE